MCGDLPNLGTVVCRLKIKRKGSERNELRKTEYMAQKFGLQSHQVVLENGSGD